MPRPIAVAGHGAVSQLRIRRDILGALVVLEDGRYAVTGPLVAIGSREPARLVGAADAPLPPTTTSAPGCRTSTARWPSTSRELAEVDELEAHGAVLARARPIV